jgi:hypothetical protein
MIKQMQCLTYDRLVLEHPSQLELLINSRRAIVSLPPTSNPVLERTETVEGMLFRTKYPHCLFVQTNKIRCCTSIAVYALPGSQLPTTKLLYKDETTFVVGKGFDGYKNLVRKKSDAIVCECGAAPLLLEKAIRERLPSQVSLSRMGTDVFKMSARQGVLALNVTALSQALGLQRQGDSLVGRMPSLTSCFPATDTPIRCLYSNFKLQTLHKPTNLFRITMNDFDADVVLPVGLYDSTEVGNIVRRCVADRRLSVRASRGSIVLSSPSAFSVVCAAEKPGAIFVEQGYECHNVTSAVVPILSSCGPLPKVGYSLRVQNDRLVQNHGHTLVTGKEHSSQRPTTESFEVWKRLGSGAGHGHYSHSKLPPDKSLCLASSNVLHVFAVSKNGVSLNVTSLASEGSTDIFLA